MWIIYILLSLAVLLLIYITTVYIIKNNVFCPKKRCELRSNVYYKKDYYKNLLKNSKEQGFKIHKKVYSEKINYNPYSKKIFSVSLYGKPNTKYTKGCFDKANYINKNLIKEWRLRIYISKEFDNNTKNQLAEIAEVYEIDDPLLSDLNKNCTEEKDERGCKKSRWSSCGAFWRFLPIFESIDVIILDADDDGLYTLHKLGSLEWQQIIDEFYNSSNKKVLRRILNVGWPTSHIAAGNIEVKNNFLHDYFKSFNYSENQIKKLIEKEKYKLMNFPVRSKFGSDEAYTSYEIYPKAKKINGIETINSWNGQFHGLNKMWIFLNFIFPRDLISTKDIREYKD
jgi:hypothetical protein